MIRPKVVVQFAMNLYEVPYVYEIAKLMLERQDLTDEAREVLRLVQNTMERVLIEYNAQIPDDLVLVIKQSP